MTIRRLKRRLIAFLSLFLLAVTARAVVVFRDGGRNLSEPTGPLAGSGWQWEGRFHGFLGTAIGPHHFLTAAHIGGFPGQTFRYRGAVYRTIEGIEVPGTDLSVWRVLGTMPTWAGLYEGRKEVGKKIVLFGVGGARGAPVSWKGKTRGWTWGAQDTRISWGTGKVWETLSGSPATTYEGTRRGPGDLLVLPFDPTFGPDTACVSGGDSGGGMFLRDGDRWRLAGVTFGMDHSFTLSPTVKKPLDASIFEARGMYRITPEGTFYLDPDSPQRYATTTLISRVSTHTDFIRAVQSRPLHIPALVWAALVGAVALPAGATTGGVLWLQRRRKPKPAVALNGVGTAR